jgi:membrane-bound metal-dependent hydrolase YbcI (DUF457 family)
MPRFETHALTSPSTFLFVNIFQGMEVNAEVIIACVLGGVLCDVDSETSIVGRTMPLVPIARRCGLIVEHRGFFHSLIFTVIMAGLLYLFIGDGHLAAWLAFLLSMLQHQALDGLSPEPIRWLAPLSRAPFRFAPNPALTTSNGSPKERKLCGVMFAFMLVLAHINYKSPRWILNSYFADVQAAIEYIHEYGNQYQLVAEFTAKELISKKVVQGRWPVEGFIGKNIILCGPDGLLRSISDTYDGDATLCSEGIHIYKGQRIHVETRTVNMAGKPLDQLRQYLDVQKHYRLFARDIVLDEPVQLTRAPVFFDPVRASGKHLTLEFATLDDLLPVRHAVVEQGEILIRYLLKPGEVLDTEIIPEVLWDIVEVSVNKMTELRVKKGDVLEVGNLIVEREKSMSKMRLNEQEQTNIQAKIRALEDIHRENKISFATQKALLESQIQEAERDLQAHQFLLKTNDVPRQDVVKREHSVRALGAEFQQLELQIEQLTIRYREQLAELELHFQRLEAEHSDMKERAYIFVRTQGTVQDIVTAQNDGKIMIKLFVEPLKKETQDSAQEQATGEHR